MEFIKGIPMPMSTTARAPTVQLGGVRPAVPQTGTRPQHSKGNPGHPYEVMVNRMYSLCIGKNIVQKRKEIQRALQALVDSQISVDVFLSRVADNIILDKGLKNYFEANMKTFRQAVSERTLNVPGIILPQQPSSLPQQPKPRASTAASHTTRKVPSQNSITAPISERPTSIVSPISRPKNAPVLPKFTTKPKTSKVSNSETTDIQKDPGCLSEGVDHLLDVAVLAGIKTEEEALFGTEHIGAQERSIKETPFLNLHNLLARCRKKCDSVGASFPQESLVMISQAAEDYLKGIIDKLASFVDLRVYDEYNNSKNTDLCEIPAQLQFLKNVEKVKDRKLKDLQKERMLRMANSRSKVLRSQNAKLRAKVKQMQAAETARVRHRESNLTALEATAPRKKFKFTFDESVPVQKKKWSEQRRANLRDAILLLEKDDLYKKSTLLALLYLK